jgi:hypothetical protein
MDDLLANTTIVSLGPGFPWVGTIILGTFVLWQLLTGTMVDGRSKPWISLKENPRKFWIVFAIEASVVLVLLAIGIVTLKP